MSSLNRFNPFARREEHNSNVLTAYRVLAPLSWALVVIVGIWYSIHSPDHPSNSHKLWDQFGRRFTPFSVDTVVVAIYWILLLFAQLFYVSHLFSKDSAVVTLAANAASHFILHNLFVIAWILLWTRNHYWPAEVILIAHFIHQQIVFWRIRGLPPISHLAVGAAPYAWTLIALFWNGAAAVHKYNPGAEITANVAIWIIFLIGAFHIFTAVDDILGHSLSLLTLGLAVAQTDRRHTPRQYIFAWIIFGIFFVKSLYITATKYSGRTVFFQRSTEPESSDAERAPLLNDSAGAA
ncbi:hypothetical protein BJY04DRAFT_198591 [Aspergillus karnatakaensis]|uniref:DUF1774 domain-containing protein n=1 Tax=Aspergillus karnatakaensis TaxID=1810916 RepID=UPI003CCE085F